MVSCLQEFHYKVAWRARGSHPGFHSSTQTGGGFEFRGHAPLLRSPDPRRIDVRASMRDPHEQIIVRLYSQHNAVPVYAVLDLSASMQFHGRRRKSGVAADFIAALGYSAYRSGDPFGVVGCDDVIRDDWSQPLTYARAAGPAFAQRLRDSTPDGREAAGLLTVADVLGSRKALIFLLSDFHFDMSFSARLLGALSHHEVVPVVLWDEAEFSALPRFGIARVTDPETRAERTLLMRPQLRRRILSRFQQRREVLLRLFQQAGVRGLFIDEAFHPDQVTRHFYQ
ncbi:MAG: DUF58 domain-containing protein [Gammaproteobacteria bacterium]